MHELKIEPDPPEYVGGGKRGRFAKVSNSDFKRNIKCNYKIQCFFMLGILYEFVKKSKKNHFLRNVLSGKSHCNQLAPAKSNWSRSRLTINC